MPFSARKSLPNYPHTMHHQHNNLYVEEEKRNYFRRIPRACAAAWVVQDTALLRKSKHVKPSNITVMWIKFIHFFIPKTLYFGFAQQTVEGTAEKPGRLDRPRMSTRWRCAWSHSSSMSLAFVVLQCWRMRPNFGPAEFRAKSSHEAAWDDELFPRNTRTASTLSSPTWDWLIRREGSARSLTFARQKQCGVNVK